MRHLKQQISRLPPEHDVQRVRVPPAIRMLQHRKHLKNSQLPFFTRSQAITYDFGVGWVVGVWVLVADGLKLLDQLSPGDEHFLLAPHLNGPLSRRLSLRRSSV
jgi:hypothetical protein